LTQIDTDYYDFSCFYFAYFQNIIHLKNLRLTASKRKEKLLRQPLLGSFPTHRFIGGAIARKNEMHPASWYFLSIMRSTDSISLEILLSLSSF
jgi:hypothetical protein